MRRVPIPLLYGSHVPSLWVRLRTRFCLNRVCTWTLISEGLQTWDPWEKGDSDVIFSRRDLDYYLLRSRVTFTFTFRLPLYLSLIPSKLSTPLRTSTYRRKVHNSVRDDTWPRSSDELFKLTNQSSNKQTHKSIGCQYQVLSRNDTSVSSTPSVTLDLPWLSITENSSGLYTSISKGTTNQIWKLKLIYTW